MMIERKIRSDLMKMTMIVAIMMGVGIYAHDFVIAGIKAKVALNSSIFLLFGIAAAMAFRNVLSLKNEVVALKALQTDFGRRHRRDLAICDTPAIVFHEPQLLGQGYRQISEMLTRDHNVQLPAKEAEMLVHSVDQRINDRKSVILYFSGLMVFMGLIGAFMGLMHTVGSVSDLIGGMDVSGGGGDDAFGKMIEGMKAPLKGMSVGFSSSLFGLSTSMVLGALERLMTSAAKALRHEYEHWLSHVTTLESAHDGEGAGAGAGAGGAAVSRAIEMASRHLGALQEAVREGQRGEARTHETLAGLHEAMAGLARTVDRVTDPGPIIAPIAAVVTDLALQQTRLAAEMELLFAAAREDRAHLRETVAALREMAEEGSVAARRREEHIVTRLDRLLACGEAGLARDPVVIHWPVADRHRQDRRAAAPEGARSLQRWLSDAFGATRERAPNAGDYRRFSQEIHASLERQQRMQDEMRREMAKLRSGIAADREKAMAIVRTLDQERGRLAELGELLDGSTTPGDVIAALDQARASMKVLSVRADRLRAELADDDRRATRVG